LFRHWAKIGMKKRNSKGLDLRACRATEDPDDGCDPKEFFKRGVRQTKPDRKARQLCQQVALTLNAVLGGECGDDVLRGLHVTAVTPAPNTAQLLVTVSPLMADDAAAAETVLAHLQNAAVQIRLAVAAAISRRRTPKLLFRYSARPVVR